MSQTVLPSNNSPLMHALAKLGEEELAGVDWRVILRAKDPAECEAKWLPWLAWENSIGSAEGWDFAETETARRQLVADYISKHQHKGTPAAIRRLFRDLQLGEVDILERVADRFWDGGIKFDGSHQFGGQVGDWAKYAIVLKRVISVRQADIVQRLLAEITPARCELIRLDYRSSALKWDGEISFNGQYTYGAVNHG